MSLLIRSPSLDFVDPHRWKDAISTLMPDLEIFVWPEMGDPDKVEVVLAQRMEADVFARLKNLKFMQLFAAGADRVLTDPDIPTGLPVARLVDGHFANTMSLFVLAAVLRYHRQLDEYTRQQSAQIWKRLSVSYASERTVGVMGLGALGGDLVQKLKALGFNALGWSRTEKQLPDIETFHGSSGFKSFISRSEILVCLLPLTPETRGILNEKTFAQMPQGSYLINVARGEHHVVDDVIAALDSGQLAGALLDVHTHDPHPPLPESPLWQHPRITLTPHVATQSSPTSAAVYVVENIRRAGAGLAPLNLVDFNTGY